MATSSPALQPAPPAPRATPLHLVAPDRIAAPDAARGLALALMVMIHAGAFAHVNLIAERYADRHLPLPGPGYLLAGLALDPAPPLFWFLVGTSVALLGRRRASEAATDRFLLVRVLVLIALDRTLISWLWAPNQPFRLAPGFELLSCLALALAFLVPVRRLGDAWLAALAAVLALGYPLVIRALPQARLEALPWPMRALVTYDFAHAPVVTFPLLGWFVLPVLGLLLGRRLRDPHWRRPRPWVLVALACFAVALLSRLTGFGDYSPWRPADGALAWFVLSKGPPGLDYLGFQLGFGLLALAALFSPRVRLDSALGRWLVLFGQVSLFLFVVHLGVCWLVGRIGLHLLRHAPAARYAFTCAFTLAALTPIAAWYRSLRARHRTVLQYL